MPFSRGWGLCPIYILLFVNVIIMFLGEPVFSFVSEFEIGWGHVVLWKRKGRFITAPPLAPSVFLAEVGLLFKVQYVSGVLSCGIAICVALCLRIASCLT